MQWWFSCFKTENFSQKDELREGHPKGHDSEDLEAVFIANLATMASELSDKFKSHTIILRE